MSDTGKAKNWNEAALSDINPHEHDFQEFKGSEWLVNNAGLIRGDFSINLSKQVSAFANGAGGRLFIGLDDDGKIDGGVPVDAKGGGLREWLEDVVPMSVEPSLLRCNVYEVGRSGPDSLIREGCAVYVLEMPSSTEAPHQAKDHRYYLRIAGKSRPMGHLHVQDVLRRNRHPRVVLSRLDPYGASERLEDGTVLLQFRVLLANEGRTMAKRVGVELVVPRPLCGRAVRERMADQGETHYTQSPGKLTFFRFHPVPVFPEQEVYTVTIWIRVTRRNLGLIRSGATIAWRVYADDAAPVVGARALSQFLVVDQALEVVAAGM